MTNAMLHGPRGVGYMERWGCSSASACYCKRCRSAKNFAFHSFKRGCQTGLAIHALTNNMRHVLPRCSMFAPSDSAACVVGRARWRACEHAALLPPAGLGPPCSLFVDGSVASGRPFPEGVARLPAWGLATLAWGRAHRSALLPTELDDRGPRLGEESVILRPGARR